MPWNKALGSLAQAAWVRYAPLSVTTYGMIGVGQIYQDLASGRLEDDDEVALTHAGAEDDFRPLSDALVSIRATLAAANDAGLLTDSETQRLVTCQKDRLVSRSSTEHRNCRHHRDGICS